MTTYYCTLDIPTSNNSSAPAPPGNMTCTVSQPVINVTHVSRPVVFTGIVEILVIIAAVVVIAILATWRHAVVTNSNYKTRKQRALEHDERMAELEVQKQRAIAGIDPFASEESKPKARR